MRMTVAGGGAAWPTRGVACGGYLVTSEGFRLLLDPGYGTMVGLPEGVRASDIDVMFVSHDHLDHCADLHPLLRARVLESGVTRRSRSTRCRARSTACSISTVSANGTGRST